MSVTLIQHSRILESDLETPVGIFLRLIGQQKGILFESAKTDGRWGRYSIAATDFILNASCENGLLHLTIADGNLNTLLRCHGKPFVEGLRELTQQLHIIPEANGSGQPPITRALYGYMDYGMAGVFEPRLARALPGEAAGASLVLPRTVILFDHTYNKITQLTLTLSGLAPKALSFAAGDAEEYGSSNELPRQPHAKQMHNHSAQKASAPCSPASRAPSLSCPAPNSVSEPVSEAISGSVSGSTHASLDNPASLLVPHPASNLAGDPLPNSAPGSMPDTLPGQAPDPVYDPVLDPACSTLPGLSTQKSYMAAVDEVKTMLREGEAIQAVLSTPFCAPLKEDPFNLYRRLRQVNPSPYMFYMNLPGITLLGSSPEVMVTCSNNSLSLCPIAGTRPRGEDPAQDALFGDELLQDPKEVAEHVMLVDLGRNDLGRIAKPGSVTLDRYMDIERFSHVMHITSYISAELEKDHDALDVLQAAFPAGTVSGAPKIRAMEIIAQMENAPRGPYAGCIGWIGLDKDTVNLDFGITIRSLWVRGRHVFWQAGAGIVHDSIPEKEWMECQNKAAVIKKVVSGTENNHSVQQ